MSHVSIEFNKEQKVLNRMVLVWIGVSWIIDGPDLEASFTLLFG